MFMFTTCALMMLEASGYGIKICLRFFIKLNNFLSNIFPVLEFLNFWRCDVEFLVSSFLLVDRET